MIEEPDFSQLLDSAAASFRNELPPRVAAIKALQGLSEISRKIEESGYRVKDIDDLIGATGSEMQRAEVGALWNGAVSAIQQIGDKK